MSYRKVNETIVSLGHAVLLILMVGITVIAVVIGVFWMFELMDYLVQTQGVDYELSQS